MKIKITILACLLAIAGYSVWTIPLPEGTIVTVPLRSIDVVSVQQPLPGDATTDTLIQLAISKRLSLSTNGVSGDVQVSANLVVAVHRAEIEALVGLPVANTQQGVLTNAVQRIAFAKLGRSIPAIAAGLAE